MKDNKLDELLIENTIDNNPSILHKLMQISTYSYIEKIKDIEYADGEFALNIYRNKINYGMNENQKKMLKTEKWNADLILIYNDNGKKICEIVEIETIKADWLLKHREKNIIKKISIVERAYNAMEMNDILKGVDEIRFSLSLNAAHMTDKERYKVSRHIGKTIRNDRNSNYKEEKLSLYNIYLLRDNIWNYCPESEEKEFLIGYNETMHKGIWKKPLKEVMHKMYENLKNPYKAKSLYEIHRFK